MRRDNSPFGYKLLYVIRDSINQFFRSNSHTIRDRFPYFQCLDTTSLNDSGLQVWLRFTTPYHKTSDRSRCWLRLINSNLNFYSASAGTIPQSADLPLEVPTSDPTRFALLQLVKRVRDLNNQIESQTRMHISRRC